MGRHDARRLALREREAALAEQARRSLTADAMLSEDPLALVLLALTARGPDYGYSLIRSLGALGFSLTSERVLYPTLGRREMAGLLEGYLVAPDEGPARKYYRMLPEGERALARGRGQWRKISGGLASLLEDRP